MSKFAVGDRIILIILTLLLFAFITGRMSDNNNQRDIQLDRLEKILKDEKCA